MTARLLTAAALLAAAFALPGCGPGTLNDERTLSLSDGGEARSIDLDASGAPQTLTVTFESSAGPVLVGVWKKEDAKELDDLITAPKSKALGSALGEKGTLTAEVPANTPVRVIARDSTKKTDVKVKVTNKK